MRRAASARVVRTSPRERSRPLERARAQRPHGRERQVRCAMTQTLSHGPCLIACFACAVGSPCGCFIRSNLGFSCVSAGAVGAPRLDLRVLSDFDVQVVAHAAIESLLHTCTCHDARGRVRNLSCCTYVDVVVTCFLGQWLVWCAVAADPARLRAVRARSADVSLFARGVNKMACVNRSVRVELPVALSRETSLSLDFVTQNLPHKSCTSPLIQC